MCEVENLRRRRKKSLHNVKLITAIQILSVSKKKN